MPSGRSTLRHPRFDVVAGKAGDGEPGRMTEQPAQCNAFVFGESLSGTRHDVSLVLTSASRVSLPDSTSCKAPSAATGLLRGK